MAGRGVVERGRKIRTGAGGGGGGEGVKVKLLFWSWLGFDVIRFGVRAWFSLTGVGLWGNWVVEEGAAFTEGGWVTYLVERNTLEWGEE